MSVAELAAKAHLSERAVQDATRELGRLRLLSVTRVKGGNAYHLPIVDRITEPAESAPHETVDHITDDAESAPRRICTPQNLHPPASKKPQVNANHAESAPLKSSDMYVVPTGSEVVEVKDVPAKPSPPPDRPDVERLCEHLAERIVANGSKRPTITRKWRDAARLLIDKDGISEDQAHRAIDWCQDHEFWRANILSMPKLREKYDQLRQQARRTHRPRHGNGDRQMQILGDYFSRIEGEEQ